ncbi:MAG: GNAT family N-acetyltransferase [Candidatus Thermoplasmatota archaeon]|jgi:RimJ/RimL family protein N-acetyltransferase|nr:GNAT family N-acetyltransferase [Candidatus Thermoplasmatota archaeon]MCL5793241.1 GNAT family N-acetyltransferase [Candidatus Thermoplasmatota archaeon]
MIFRHAEPGEHLKYDIREARPSDARGIISCMQGVMDERVFLVGEYYMWTEKGEQDRIRNPDDLTLVCQYGDRIVGVLTLQRGYYRKNRHTAQLGIAVGAGHRHNGVGTRMISYAIDWSRSRGIRKVNLEVFSTNKNAIEAYRKLGFMVEGVRKNQFIIEGMYVDDILMSLDLNQ